MTSIYTRRPSSLITAHGWSMRPTRATSSMSASTRTASFPSPGSSRPWARTTGHRPQPGSPAHPTPSSAPTTNERIKEIFGEDERMVATLEKDTTNGRDECLMEIYRKLRPGDPPTVGSPPSPCSTACSLTAAATTFPTSAAISSTRSSASAPQYRTALRWQCPSSDPSHRRDHRRRRARCMTRATWPSRSTTAGVVERHGSTSTARPSRVFSNGMVPLQSLCRYRPRAELGVKEKVRGIVLQEPHGAVLRATLSRKRSLKI